MAERSILADSRAKRQHHEEAVVEQEDEKNTEIASQLEHYAFAIGAFRDDPMLDAMMANIRERKREMNADDNIR
jgi:hypothetical protein